jgi:hypothetical protein
MCFDLYGTSLYLPRHLSLDANRSKHIPDHLLTQDHSRSYRTYSRFAKQISITYLQKPVLAYFSPLE